MYKGYTFEDVLKMQATAKLAPKPFPGKYPTRIVWEAGGERYIGKPSQNALMRFWRLNEKNGLALAFPAQFIEFDMAHVVGITATKQSWLRQQACWVEALTRGKVAPLGEPFHHRYFVQYLGNYSGKLAQFYHPNARAGVGTFEFGARVMTSAWRTGNENLGVQRVYVVEPLPKRADRDHWRAQLVGVGI